MRRHTPGILTVICAAGLVCSPALAGTVTYSIAPSTIDAAPGDVGDAFEVLLTNGSASSIDVQSFFFQVSVTDTDISFTNANFSTTPNAYIFAGDSFDQNPPPSTLYTNTLPALFVDGSDLTNDGAGITVTSGESLALGEVYFNVAAGAAGGPATVSFSGSSASNSLSDPSGDSIAIGSLTSGTIDIASSTNTPEPSSLFLTLGAMAARFGRIRRGAGKSR
jgi:hypothetical protein